YEHPQYEAVKKGMENLRKHIENCIKFQLKPVVAINHFSTDDPQEIQYIIDECQTMGVKAILAEEFTKGGAGMEELAAEVVNATMNNCNDFHPLNHNNDTVVEKIEKIATVFYGANGINFTH